MRINQISSNIRTYRSAKDIDSASVRNCTLTIYSQRYIRTGRTGITCWIGLSGAWFWRSKIENLVFNSQILDRFSKETIHAFGTHVVEAERPTIPRYIFYKTIINVRIPYKEHQLFTCNLREMSNPLTGSALSADKYLNRLLLVSGARFGMIQTKICLAVLLGNFKYTLNSRTKLPLEYNPTSFVDSLKNLIYLDTERIE